MSSTYRILDEPTPGRFADYAVSPQTIFVTACLGGGWLALPWFAFNAIAIGSVNKKTELRMALASPILSVVMAFVIFGFIDALGIHATHTFLSDVLGIPARAGAYAVVAIMAVKVAILYQLSRSQQKSFDIYQYMGGKSKNALAVAAVAYFLRPYVIKLAFAISFYFGMAVI